MKKIYISIFILILLAVAGLSFRVDSATKKAEANPSVFNIKPPLTVGTTTPFTASSTFATYQYLKAGVSTSTTNVLDSWAAGTYGALDSASLFVQLTATSTPPTLRWRYEFSQDAIDWYSEDIELTTNASTTVHVRDYKEHSWVFASTTANGLAGVNRAHKLLSVPTPTRYVRVVFYLPTGSADAVIFQQWVSKNQR